MGNNIQYLDCCKNPERDNAEISDVNVKGSENGNSKKDKVEVARSNNRFVIEDTQNEKQLSQNRKPENRISVRGGNDNQQTPGNPTNPLSKPRLSNNNVSNLEKDDGKEINKGVNRNLILRTFIKEDVARRESEYGVPFSREYAIKKSNMSESSLKRKFPEEDMIFDHGSLVANKSFYYGQRNKALNRHGYGTLYLMDGKKYEGFWINNEFSLFGRHIDNELNIYEGDFKAGKLHGEGIESTPVTLYKGTFVDGIKHGRGSLESENEIYEGTFENGVKSGKGKIQFIKTNNFYEGDFSNGKIEGQGTFRWANGDEYTGQFENGVLHGKGIYRWNNGDIYEGSYVNGMRSGQGRLQNANGKVYEGSFENNLPHGKGIIIKEGKVTDVEFNMGVPLTKRKSTLRSQKTEN